jgi:hypothetical protein
MTCIYHITHISNLPCIIAAGGLWCDTVRSAKVASGATVIGIAHQHIKERRARKVVNRVAGGTLADYVPFYFAPRSPMLFTISRGNVAGYAGGQEQVIHLVSTVELASGLSNPWCFTDGHADMEISKQYDDLASLDNVDWDIMKEIWWNDTMNDGDRKRRRQAEFLVHHAFPWTAITEIGVISEKIAGHIQAAMNGAVHQPAVVVRSDWYY